MTDSTVASPKKRNDTPLLDSTHYHAVLLGTGLTNSIVASSLSKSSHTVLHLDGAAEYGSQLATFNFANFKEWCESHAGSLSEQVKPTPTEEQLREWRESTKDVEAKVLEFEPVELTTTFFNATFQDFTQPTANPVENTKEKEDKQAASNDSTTATNPSTPSITSVSTDASSTTAASSVPTIAPLIAESRKYSIDLTPHLIFSRSPIIDLLVAAGIHNYLEFKAVDHLYFASNIKTDSNPLTMPALNPLPLSKSAIFQTSALSMLDKRLLTKFMHLILGDDYHQPTTEVQKQTQLITQLTQSSTSASSSTNTTSEPSSQTFLDFLRAQKLTPPLIQMILYAVALLDESLDAVATVSAGIGISRLRTYLSSLGRYGPGAFLYPSYGVSELPQSFVRLCAVNKGIFMLRIQPEAIVYEKSTNQVTDSTSSTITPSPWQYKGIILPGGQFIASNSLISEHDYLSLDANPSADSFSYVSRAVLILDGPLPSSTTGTPIGAPSFFSLASCRSDESPIYGMQLGVDANATPRGRTLVYLWTTAYQLDQAKTNSNRLRTIVQTLTNPLQPTLPSSPSTSKPTLLALATYQQRITRSAGPDVLSSFPAPPPPIESTPAVTEPTASTPSDSTADSATIPSTDSADTNDSQLHPPEPIAPPLPSMLIASAPPSSSPAFGLDGCLSQAERIFSLLCPELRFPEVMKTTMQEEQNDQELALLHQIDPVTSSSSQTEIESTDEANSTATEGQGQSQSSVTSEPTTTGGSEQSEQSSTISNSDSAATTTTESTKAI